MREIEDVGALAKTYDLAVSGAGPAGMAAEAAAGLGLSTLALDENAGPGGQIYRAVTSTPVRTRATLGEDYWRGAELAASFGASNGDYARAATVWSVGPGFDAEERENGLEVVVSLGGSAHLVGAKEVVLAMGALERPFPIPGWTLPGVMTAGAAQIALKTSGLDPYALTYHTMSTGLSLSRRLGQSADSGRARPGRLQGGEGHQGQA